MLSYRWLLYFFKFLKMSWKPKPGAFPTIHIHFLFTSGQRSKSKCQMGWRDSTTVWHLPWSRLARWTLSQWTLSTDCCQMWPILIPSLKIVKIYTEIVGDCLSIWSLFCLFLIPNHGERIFDESSSTLLYSVFFSCDFCKSTKRKWRKMFFFPEKENMFDESKVYLQVTKYIWWPWQLPRVIWILQVIHTHWITLFVPGLLTSHRKYVTSRYQPSERVLWNKSSNAVFSIALSAGNVCGWEWCWTLKKEISPVHAGNRSWLFGHNKYRFDGQMPWVLGGLGGVDFLRVTMPFCAQGQCSEDCITRDAKPSYENQLTLPFKIQCVTWVRKKVPTLNMVKQSQHNYFIRFLRAVGWTLVFLLWWV